MTAVSNRTKRTRPQSARILYISYTEYPQRWDEIASVFSRDAVLKGSFDKYGRSPTRPSGVLPKLMTNFSKPLKSWRKELGRKSRTAQQEPLPA